MPSVTYQPGSEGVDSWTRQNAPTSSFPDTGTLFLANVSGAARRVFIAVSLSAAGVRVGARIDSLVITLTKQSLPTGPVSVLWSAVTPFVEALTWNTMPGAFGASIADTVTADAGTHVTPNLGALAQFAAHGNDGQVAYLRVICADEGSGLESFAFHSSDAVTESDRPLFGIDYTAPTPRGRGMRSVTRPRGRF